LALCPVGLRFHALHHLFPGMPYHNLEAAHHRLMQHLPAAHPYRECVADSMLQVIRELLAHVRQNSQPALFPAGAFSSPSSRRLDRDHHRDQRVA
jgi:fatty acid desaturase